jgi:hypothetical protein
MTPEERKEFISDITIALQGTHHTCLTDDEQRWVKLAIESEGQRALVRKAIIEKTLSSLLWSAIVGLGYIFIGWASNHGYKQ